MPCGTAKFREETSKKQRDRSRRCDAQITIASFDCKVFLRCSIPKIVTATFLPAQPSGSYFMDINARMRLNPLLIAPVLISVILSATEARAASAAIPLPSALCRSAILLAERATRVPDRLLNAIATVESGRRDPISGSVYPWPWAINVEGAGHFYDTKALAIAAVRDFQAQGIRSIDVGCMQVNLMYHPEAFTSLEQAFDPIANADYAARFLTRLFAQTNAWPRAAAAYHSWTPELGADYARKVLAAWGVPQPPPAALDAAAIGALAESAAPPASGTYTAPAGGRVAVMMPTGSNAIRVVTMAGPPGPGGVGRGLDGYRATPIISAGALAAAYSPRPGRPSGF